MSTPAWCVGTGDSLHDAEEQRVDFLLEPHLGRPWLRLSAWFPFSLLHDGAGERTQGRVPVEEPPDLLTKADCGLEVCQIALNVAWLRSQGGRVNSLLLPCSCILCGLIDARSLMVVGKCCQVTSDLGIL